MKRNQEVASEKIELILDSLGANKDSIRKLQEGRSPLKSGGGSIIGQAQGTSFEGQLTAKIDKVESSVLRRLQEMEESQIKILSLLENARLKV